MLICVIEVVARCGILFLSVVFLFTYLTFESDFVVCRPVYVTRHHIDSYRQSKPLCREVTFDMFVPCTYHDEARPVSCFWQVFRSELLLFMLHMSTLVFGVVKASKGHGRRSRGQGTSTPEFRVGDANATCPLRFCHIGTKRRVMWLSKYAKIGFRPGLCPDPAGGAHDAPSDLPVG